jgi:hypothetical protein
MSIRASAASGSDSRRPAEASDLVWDTQTPSAVEVDRLGGPTLAEQPRAALAVEVGPRTLVVVVGRVLLSQPARCSPAEATSDSDRSEPRQQQHAERDAVQRPVHQLLNYGGKPDKNDDDSAGPHLRASRLTSCTVGRGDGEDVPFLREPFPCWILAVRTPLEVHGVPGCRQRFFG